MASFGDSAAHVPAVFRRAAFTVTPGVAENAIISGSSTSFVGNQEAMKAIVASVVRPELVRSSGVMPRRRSPRGDWKNSTFDASVHWSSAIAIDGSVLFNPPFKVLRARSGCAAISCSPRER